MFSIIGAAIGVYICLIIILRDWNIRRGMDTLIEKIVHNSFKEARQNASKNMTEKEVTILAKEIVSEAFHEKQKREDEVKFGERISDIVGDNSFD